jgi:L-amino acid N-acyltransferase YncA
MIVRNATQDEADAISTIWAPQILDSVVTFNSVVKTPGDVAVMIETRPCFMVADVGGAVVGFATYDQFRGGIGYQHTMEHTIILEPAAQGQGAGRALMRAVIDHARARQVHALWAGVSAENAAGVAFHAKLGFEHLATLPQVGRKFDRWMDLVLMQKRL